MQRGGNWDNWGGRRPHTRCRKDTWENRSGTRLSHQTNSLPRIKDWWLGEPGQKEEPPALWYSRGRRGSENSPRIYKREVDTMAGARQIIHPRASSSHTSIWEAQPKQSNTHPLLKVSGERICLPWIKEARHHARRSQDILCTGSLSGDGTDSTGI